MYFFDDKLGRRRVCDVVRVSSGQMVEHGRKERLTHLVELANGESLTLLHEDVQAIQRTPASVFAAEAGLMAFVGDDEDGSPLLSPVLAWALTLGGAVRPILSTGVNDDQNADLPIVYSDGTVRYLGFNVYSSLEAYRTSGADQPDT